MIYTCRHTLSLPDALAIGRQRGQQPGRAAGAYREARRAGQETAPVDQAVHVLVEQAQYFRIEVAGLGPALVAHVVPPLRGCRESSLRRGKYAFRSRPGGMPGLFGLILSPTLLGQPTLNLEQTRVGKICVM